MKQAPLQEQAAELSAEQLATDEGSVAAAGAAGDGPARSVAGHHRPGQSDQVGDRLDERLHGLVQAVGVGEQVPDSDGVIGEPDRKVPRWLLSRPLSRSLAVCSGGAFTLTG